MPCEIRDNMIICSRSSRKRRRCSVCHVYDGTQLCDGVIGASKTCDAPLCKRCTKRVASDKDYCPVHFKEGLV